MVFRIKIFTWKTDVYNTYWDPTGKIYTGRDILDTTRQLYQELNTLKDNSTFIQTYFSKTTKYYNQRADMSKLVSLPKEEIKSMTLKIKLSGRY